MKKILSFLLTFMIALSFNPVFAAENLPVNYTTNDSVILNNNDKNLEIDNYIPTDDDIILEIDLSKNKPTADNISLYSVKNGANILTVYGKFTDKGAFTLYFENIGSDSIDYVQTERITAYNAKGKKVDSIPERAIGAIAPGVIIHENYAVDKSAYKLKFKVTSIESEKKTTTSAVLKYD